jgi:hypothetical protein
MSDQKQQAEATQKVDLDNLTPQQALSILIQGVEIAQKRGAYNFDESGIIGKAINAFKGSTQPATDQPATDQPATDQPAPEQEAKVIAMTPSN